MRRSGRGLLHRQDRGPYRRMVVVHAADNRGFDSIIQHGRNPAEDGADTGSFGGRVYK